MVVLSQWVSWIPLDPLALDQALVLVRSGFITLSTALVYLLGTNMESKILWLTEQATLLKTQTATPSSNSQSAAALSRHFITL